MCTRSGSGGPVGPGAGCSTGTEVTRKPFALLPKQRSLQRRSTNPQAGRQGPNQANTQVTPDSSAADWGISGEEAVDRMLEHDPQNGHASPMNFIGTERAYFNYKLLRRWRRLGVGGRSVRREGFRRQRAQDDDIYAAVLRSPLDCEIAGDRVILRVAGRRKPLGHE